MRAWLARRLRSPLLWALLAVAALYSTTLFPGVGGRVNTGDSAKFQFIGAVLGVSHPPGNPLYLLLDALFVRLPLGRSAALRITLLSFVCALLALALVGRALTRSFGVRAGVYGVLALALGPLFWTFATEAEVYSLNACLVAGSCEAALRFERTGQRRALMLCAGFVLLGCANHLTSVLLAPAVLYLALRARHTPGRLTAGSVAWLAVLGLACAALYAYVPLRVHQRARYSELLGGLSYARVVRYLSAEQFQSGFALPTVSQLWEVRLPAFFAQLQKQWLWPVFAALAPLGFMHLWRRARGSCVFLLLGLTGFCAVALIYDIPDPDGFYVPIVTLLALPLGAALGKLRGRSQLLLPLVALAMAGPALTHVRTLRDLVGREVVYSVLSFKPILWDLDDLFARIPERANFAVPCNTYGCVEVINYYRFAQPAVAERGIGFVLLPGWNPNYLIYAPVEVRPFRRARLEVICTLRKNEARQMERAGARVRTIERPERLVAGTMHPGVPIYCSEPLPL